MSSGKIHPAWKQWIAENKMLQVPDDHILGILVQNGISEEAARRHLSCVSKTHSYQAGTRLAQRYRKLESLLEVYRQLSQLADRTIERRSNVSRAEFFERYYAANRPVIITDIMKGWKALSSWSPAYFKELCGDMTVEITAGRESDKQYEVNLQDHKALIRFGDYIDAVVNGGTSNDYYLVANNFFFKQEGARLLCDDFEQFPEYLDDSRVSEYGSMWFGPAGSITPLHHDVMNILFAQVFGRKRFTLIPSNHVHVLYNDKGVFSEVDVENPDFDKYPMFKDVSSLQVVVEPGEVVFIPVGWWHHVRALDVSISLSFTNFLFPNTYNWNNPQIYR